MISHFQEEPAAGPPTLCPGCQFAIVEAAIDHYGKDLGLDLTGMKFAVGIKIAEKTATIVADGHEPRTYTWQELGIGGTC